VRTYRAVAHDPERALSNRGFNFGRSLMDYRNPVRRTLIHQQWYGAWHYDKYDADRL